jgi:lipopolysaccharide transport system permease protein
MQLLKAIWAYRGFVLGHVKREFQAKYRNSVLGASWAVLQPIALILVYTVVFSQVMRARLPGVDTPFAYGIYLCAGILTWGLFAEIVSRTQNVFIDNANLLKKLNFPRACLPAMVVLSALLNFCVVFGLFTVFLLLSGNFPGVVYLGLLPLLAIHTAFAAGLGVTLGVLNVFFRDVGQFFSIVLQFWFWLTPLVYAASVLPRDAQALMAYNPLAVLAVGYQTIIVGGHWPHWQSLWPVAVAAVLLCLLGLHLFKKHSADMVDEL